MTITECRKRLMTLIDDLAHASALTVNIAGKDSAIAVMCISCLNHVLAVEECSRGAGEAEPDMLRACIECICSVSDCLSAAIKFNMPLEYGKIEPEEAAGKVEQAQAKIERLVELSRKLDPIVKGGIPTDLGEKMVDEIVAGKR